MYKPMRKKSTWRESVSQRVSGGGKGTDERREMVFRGQVEPRYRAVDPDGKSDPLSSRTRMMVHEVSGRESVNLGGTARVGSCPDELGQGFFL